MKVILALLVNSGHHYQEWKINDQSKSEKALYISAGIHFGLFILCLIWKFLKERQIARQERRSINKGFNRQQDDDISQQYNYNNSQPRDPNQRQFSNTQYQQGNREEGAIN